MEEDNIILQAVNITKKFAGVTALDNVSINVHKGKVNVIVGENGAGKSTLMKILSGVYPEYDGTLLLQGEPVNFSNPKDAMSKGIAIIHQELNLIPYLSISANIFLGREIVDPLGLLDFKKMNAITKRLLERVECNVPATTLVSSLRVGQQQQVEIAKALLEDAKVVIMDEPTSAITDAEVEVLFRIIASLKKQQVSIVYISHKLDELFLIADRFVGLRDGKMVGTIENAEQGTKDDLIRLMVGRDITNLYIKDTLPLGDEIFKVENVSLPKPSNASQFLVNNVSFSLRKGEVLGVFGLMGAGRTELLETLFGLHSERMSGSIFIDGRKVDIRSVKDAVANGMGLVPEDRKKDGLVLSMPIYKNVSMASLDQVIDNGFLNNRAENGLAKQYIADLKIKTPSQNERSKNLSGGNQQKVVLSKWLATTPKILFLDEPTRGIDVNAKNEIYHWINTLAKRGLGVLVVSSELPEIMAICDRIIVMGKSRITGEFTKNEATEDIIMNAAIL
ncbi:monosaccharide ABC transporter ATP-binding protein, CUT2 family [Maribacter sedimenticola]|uniref:Monosaccharide ABC transporter ATP-binding protein, CUT2 family n=1 Tax=Maribacter sedimenticola TaxID=228956 RepID=A0ABY1SDC3_9FLAO|nr:sugar ABC transporter ATP-binding protein [Maribacter sedimenticola]SNR28331.1 monosaccharide ABC transporter ATP-binding protein, CUT2 family [Maribacter sedimenticola]